MVGPLFSQSAWNNVTFAGEEVRDPGRTLPFALLVVGCLVVTVLYVLTNAAYLRTLGFAGIAHAPEDRVGTAAAERALRAAGRAGDGGGDHGVDVRVRQRPRSSRARGSSFAMARDGLFFRGLARLNRGRRARQRALAAGGLGRRSSCSPGTYSQLLKYVVSADMLLYVLLVLAVVVLRRERRTWPRPFRAPGYPWLQLAYAAAGWRPDRPSARGNPRTTWPGYADPRLGRARSISSGDAARQDARETSRPLVDASRRRAAGRVPGALRRGGQSRRRRARRRPRSGAARPPRRDPGGALAARRRSIRTGSAARRIARPPSNASRREHEPRRGGPRAAPAAAGRSTTAQDLAELARAAPDSGRTSSRGATRRRDTASPSSDSRPASRT